MPPKKFISSVEFVATHIRRQLPIPIHILRKSIDNVLTNIPKRKWLLQSLKKGNKLEVFHFPVAGCVTSFETQKQSVT